jgi:flagellar basal body-associated protein FliL
MATQEQQTQSKPQKNKKNLVIFEIVLAVLVLAGLAVLINWHRWFGYQSSVVETGQKARIVKIVKTYKDLREGEDLLPDHSQKKMTIAEIPPGTQILNVVTNVTEEFRLPKGEGVAASNLIVEKGGLQLSSGDIATLPSLQSIHFENRKGNTGEIGIYSLTDPVSLVLRVHSDANADLTKLNSGILEVYITEVSP